MCGSISQVYLTVKPFSFFPFSKSLETTVLGKATRDMSGYPPDHIRIFGNMWYNSHVTSHFPILVCWYDM